MPHPDRRRRRRGVALAAAIFALAVIGGLVAGAFSLALLEQQSGRNTLFIVQASEAAEAGVRDLLQETPAEILKALPVGASSPSLAPATPIPGAAVVGQVLRLADNLFLVRARAARLDAAGGELASRSIGLLAHWSGDTLEGPAFLQPIRERSWVQLY